MMTCLPVAMSNGLISPAMGDTTVRRKWPPLYPYCCAAGTVAGVR
jgi:hypothetical protein